MDSRIYLMQGLDENFDVFAAGTLPRLNAVFQQAGFEFDTYPMARGVNPVADVRTLVSLIGLF